MAKKKTRRRSKPKGLPGKIVGEMNGLPIRRVQAGALTGADYNPREISDEALDGLKASIGEFGLTQPVVWNKRTRRIVGGHQRTSTMHPDEFTDVVEVDLSLDEEKALNLALNSPYMAGEFNTRLASLIEEVSVTTPDLASSLRIPDMSVDVPSFDVDDLIEDDQHVNDGSKSDPSQGVGQTPREQSDQWENSKLRQIVLVLTNKQNKTVTRQFKKVIKEQNVESFSAAAIHLAREYAEAH